MAAIFVTVTALAQAGDNLSKAEIYFDETSENIDFDNQNTFSASR